MNRDRISVAFGAIFGDEKKTVFEDASLAFEFSDYNEFGFLPQDEERLAAYYAERFLWTKENPNILNRTFKGRLEDHEFLMRQLTGKDRMDAREKQALLALREILKLDQDDQKLVFFDIGPGLGNPEYPGITGVEMAEEIPEMEVVLLDLPENVDHFTGEKKIRGHKRITRRQREGVLKYNNVHILSGDGLVSLLDQWNDLSTNPYNGERPRAVSVNDESTTVIVRAANSIDIYCDWEDLVRPSVTQIAIDFRNQPVMYLFNEVLMVKPAGTHTWTIVGQVSQRGFNHYNRELSRANLGGQPFVLDKDVLAQKKIIY